MATRICALLVGAAYLFFGAAGLNRDWVFRPPHELQYYQMSMIGQWGYLFNWMPVNPVHDVVYIILGGGGILSAVSMLTATGYLRGMFVIGAMFAFIGFLPLGADHLWGLIPLFGWNVMFHAVTVTIVYYFGFIYPLGRSGSGNEETDLLQPAIRERVC